MSLAGDREPVARRLAMGTREDTEPRADDDGERNEVAGSNCCLPLCVLCLTPRSPRKS